METLHFSILIQAPKEKIWAVLWDDATYRQWTSAFCEGTYAVSDWEEGSKIHFLSPTGEGMNSLIQTKQEYEYMAFKHLGELKNFQEMPIDEATQVWTGAMETYRLTTTTDGVLLETTMDCLAQYQQYFEDTFPKGLTIVKQLSETK
ncbi:SRPBCC domain-containing protein [Flavobacterium sp. RSSB_23]|uniref:SRPBCC domain-containing protein n=1 Tax=Flavobacterium sp. RSSB_23 TaxID=3447668 RepID=UPI003F2F69E7